MPRPWYIVGCGYVGTRLARRLLARGDEVVVTRRTTESCDQLREALAGAAPRRFALGEDLAVAEEAVVVLSSPPGPDSPEGERRLAQSLPDSSRLIYLSTTGVYGHGQGGEVADDFSLAPASARGQARLDVERAIQEAHVGSVCLRVPGIYGPRRGVHARMRRGEYRLIGPGNTLVARIHVDDLATAILLLGDTPKLSHTEFVVGDEEPCSSRDHALGVAARLQLPTPPEVDPQSVSATVRAMLGSDRRVVPKRLRELGWRARYPSWREGLEQALAEEAEAS
jgi:nucleoside-diphosphate-sugar epimerase